MSATKTTAAGETIHVEVTNSPESFSFLWAYRARMLNEGNALHAAASRCFAEADRVNRIMDGMFPPKATHDRLTVQGNDDGR